MSRTIKGESPRTVHEELFKEIIEDALNQILYVPPYFWHIKELVQKELDAIGYRLNWIE